MTAAPSGLIYTPEFLAAPEERELADRLGRVDLAAFHPRSPALRYSVTFRTVLTSAR